jgi:hypothetical protein
MLSYSVNYMNFFLLDVIDLRWVQDNFVAGGLPDEKNWFTYGT